VPSLNPVLSEVLRRHPAEFIRGLISNACTNNIVKAGMLARRLNGNGRNRILFVPPPKDAFLALPISPNECATRPMHVSSSDHRQGN